MGIWEKLQELWQYRELIRNLVLRDLKARYKNSILGIAWSWLNPLLMMTVYTLVFNVMAGNAGLPNYPIFVLCALLPWNFFSVSVTRATESIIEASSLVKKVYFPREILPISIVMGDLVNFLISLPVFFLLALIMGNPITLWALALPLILLVQLFFTIGVSLITATINVFYRDTHHILNVLILAWMFLTPIFYPITTIPEAYSFSGGTINLRTWLQRLNPLASIIPSYRDTLYWGRPPSLNLLLLTMPTSLIILIVGYLIFQHYSSQFAEEI
jgi:ABC-type polysaccharide/polyol phosphate export permease